MANVSAGNLLMVVGLATTGCFNPDPVPVDTDDGATGSTAGPATTMSSDPTVGSDPTSGPTTVGETADETTAAEDTGDPPECSGDEDCADMPSECEVASCNAQGICEVSNATEGTACGDASDTGCDAADTCDGNGSCLANVAADGMDCDDCDSGQCTCSAGRCGECVAYADTNLFSTDRSLRGWELSGDWGLYTEAPASQNSQTGALYPAIPFSNQVLGTDGNRNGPSYPGGHMEFSYARTPPTELPTSLEFQSWHLDEGAGSFDNKIIRISTDGGATWTDIISCVIDPALPFCQRVEERDAADWDAISLDLPAPLIGQVGIIEFAYDTFDGCCSFEKGWYIDVTNFATECACTANEACEPYGSECAAGVCGANAGCNVDPVAAGMACGSADDNTCTAADTCDGFGYCQVGDNYASYAGGGENEVLACDFCGAGDDCVGCAGGACQDCEILPDLESFEPMTFSPFLAATSGWEFEALAGGNWRVFSNIPNNENNDGTLFPTNAPFFGIDGSTLGAGDDNGEVSNASAVTRPDTFSDVLVFRSWHQDEGGAGADRKTIELTVDGGTTWIPLADCSVGGALSAFPFCTGVNTRDAEDWDDISIDTAAYADMEGQIRFSYDTGDACCGFERGWFIDDLNLSQMCDSPNDSGLSVPCIAWNSVDACNDDQSCAWDGGTASCIQCTFLTQLECDAEPVCAWRVGEDGSTRCAQAPQ